MPKKLNRQCRASNERGWRGLTNPFAITQQSLKGLARNSGHNHTYLRTFIPMLIDTVINVLRDTQVLTPHADEQLHFEDRIVKCLLVGAHGLFQCHLLLSGLIELC